MLWCAAGELVMFGSEWTSEERRALMRAFAATAVVTLVCTLVLEAPFIPYAWRPEGLDRLVLLYLAPQGFPIAIAVGLAVGTLAGLGGGLAPSRRSTAAMIALAAAASVVSLVDVAWIAPVANQAFRVLVTGNPDIVRGASEMTLGELWRAASPETRFAFHMRWALTLSPLILAVLAASIVRASRRAWLSGPGVVIGFVACYLLPYGGRAMTLDGRVPACAAAWLPNVGMAMMAVAMTRTAHRRRGTHDPS
jgi:hypothetical protein